MPAHIIDGKAIAAELTVRIAADAATLIRATRVLPALAVILVGDDPASRVYVASKSRKAAETGIAAIDHRLPAQASQAQLLDLIHSLNADPGIHGILVQLPLPPQISARHVIQAIAPAKDVDGFHPINIGLLASGQRENAFVPCTPMGSLMLLKRQLGRMDGANAVVLGRSNIVGRPMAQLLLAENCTVTMAHSHTHEIADVCQRADIVIAAIGKPGIVRGDWIKPGATVIDVGINRMTAADGRSRIVGDVAFDEVRLIARAMTPVPGGVGPMTIACLLANTVTAAARTAGRTPPDWLS